VNWLKTNLGLISRNRSGTASELTRHHIIARSSGGSDDPKNILHIPSDLHHTINGLHRAIVRRVKETSTTIRDVAHLTADASELYHVGRNSRSDD
jgi:hypothetical protein